MRARGIDQQFRVGGIWRDELPLVLDAVRAGLALKRVPAPKWQSEGAVEEALRGGRLLKTIPHLCPFPMAEEIYLLALNSSPGCCFLHAAATAFKLKSSICSLIS